MIKYIIITLIVLFFLFNKKITSPDDIKNKKSKIIETIFEYNTSTDVDLDINKYKIWTYWENKPGKDIPPYINLCFKILNEKCKSRYDIKILNDKTILNYLPNLPSKLNNLMLAQKVDYIRVALLYKYGGIWIDADTIIMNDLKEIQDKLIKYDFIGFGCTRRICFDGYLRPSNGVMASQINGKLMKKSLEILDDKLESMKLNQIGYFDFGKYILWQAIDELIETTNYIYYHFSSEYDGTRNKNGIWIHTGNHLSKSDTELLNINKLMFVFLENNKLNGSDEDYNWFGKLPENDIINGPYWISKLFRKALNI